MLCRGSESHLSSSFLFSMVKELFRLVVLPCFDLCSSKSSHVHTCVRTCVHTETVISTASLCSQQLSTERLTFNIVF